MILLLTGLVGATCPDAVNSPTLAWPDRSAESDPSIIASLDQALFQERNEETREGVTFDALAIFYRRQLLYERSDGCGRVDASHSGVAGRHGVQHHGPRRER